MRRPFQFLTLLVVAIAGWIQRDQQAAIVCVFGHDAHPRRRGERCQAWLFYIGGSGDRRGPFNDSVNVRFSEAGRITPSVEADF